MAYVLQFIALFIALHQRRTLKWADSVKGTVMQIEKALINDCLRVSKVS